jgi:tetratricopeptide (TPR) repeat protein
MCSLGEGDWESAERHLDEAVAISTRGGSPDVLLHAQRLLAEYALLRDRPEEVPDRLEPLLDHPGLPEYNVPALLTTLAQAYLQTGDTSRAEEALTESVQRATAANLRFVLVDARRVEGVLRIGQNRFDEARRALEEAVSLARATEFPYAEGRGLSELGILYQRMERASQARELLLTAQAIFNRLGARHDLLRTEQALTPLDAER